MDSVFSIVLGQQQQPRGLDSLPGPARLLVVGRVAAATFWDMLAGFVGLGLAPLTWLAEVHSIHDTFFEGAIHMDRINTPARFYSLPTLMFVKHDCATTGSKAFPMVSLVVQFLAPSLL